MNSVELYGFFSAIEKEGGSERGRELELQWKCQRNQYTQNILWKNFSTDVCALVGILFQRPTELLIWNEFPLNHWMISSMLLLQLIERSDQRSFIPWHSIWHSILCGQQSYVCSRPTSSHHQAVLIGSKSWFSLYIMVDEMCPRIRIMAVCVCVYVLYPKLNMGIGQSWRCRIFLEKRFDFGESEKTNAKFCCRKNGRLRFETLNENL